MSQKNASNQETELLFGKKNYAMIGVAVVIMLVGYLLMTGGGNPQPEIFNAEEKYSFVRTTLSPILILVGILITGIAIFTKP